MRRASASSFACCSFRCGDCVGAGVWRVLVPIRSVCAGSCAFGMCGGWEGLFVGCCARSLRSGRVRFVGPQRSRVWVCLRFSAFVSGVSLGSACRSRMWGCGVCGPRRAFCLPPLPAHRSSVVPLLTGLHSRPPPPLAIGIPRPSPSSRLRLRCSVSLFYISLPSWMPLSPRVRPFASPLSRVSMSLFVPLPRPRHSLVSCSGYAAPPFSFGGSRG